MARVLHQRRQTGGIAQQMHKLLGLEQKMRQYEVGEKFVRGVLDLGGPRAIDHAWSRPENLPVARRARRPRRVARRACRSCARRSLRLARYACAVAAVLVVDERAVRASRPWRRRARRPRGTASPSRARAPTSPTAMPEPIAGRDRCCRRRPPSAAPGTSWSSCAAGGDLAEVPVVVVVRPAALEDGPARGDRGRGALPGRTDRARARWSPRSTPCSRPTRRRPPSNAASPGSARSRCWRASSRAAPRPTPTCTRGWCT